jgi:hypothetical protein
VTDEKRDRQRASYKRWYERNLEHARAVGRARTKAWRAGNKEKVKTQRAVNRLKHEYGLTPEALAAIYETQGRQCAVCGAARDLRGPNGLVIDHCHKSGAVRGLLCSSCNVGIGHFRENPEYLVAAKRYLEAHRE